ncbi:unnamed protein product [Notodromas monacha]|uniref:Intraflagellar transport protein 56 n=1 Tax=Notodromas monacha TaxID=399045 RepID=A0A7R9BE88_9CRUS|nr:unnamed protein product [Notodromas monacha]CAG0913187.1 unnamed protein product [Notodromas monacha]
MSPESTTRPKKNRLLTKFSQVAMVTCRPTVYTRMNQREQIVLQTGTQLLLSLLRTISVANMILSRLKPASKSKPGSAPTDTKTKKHVPTADEFFQSRDFTGAMTVLEFDRNSGKGSDATDELIGYCAFHLGDYKRALLEYDAISKRRNPPLSVWVHLGCCYFYLGMLTEAEEMSPESTTRPKKNRLLTKFSQVAMVTCRPTVYTRMNQREQIVLQTGTQLLLSLLRTISVANMILSRLKPASKSKPGSAPTDTKTKKHVPTADEFFQSRDFTGAMTVLEFDRNSGKGSDATDELIGYCAFHLGDYKRALLEYDAISKRRNPPSSVWVHLGCCYFYLGMLTEAEEMATKAENSRLKTRLMFHLSHKLNDETKLMEYHQMLEDIIEDQLCLASIHYLRSHYQEAIDIYKRILTDNRDYLALNVYIALCYYKLDYYDVSQEMLQTYLQQYPDSLTAVNLKACNHFRLYNGKAAEAELKALKDACSPNFRFGDDLIKHNLVVFRNGEGALQVLPGLVDVIPEARLNLVIYHLKQDELRDAFSLISELEPTVPQEYILKGVVHAAIGQETGSRDQLKSAQQYFQLVGGSASECDTIPGRQCMASCFFLLKQFDDVLLYLNSIKSYFFNDDVFNFNYAQAKAAAGNYEEAEEAFKLIQSEKLKSDYAYLSWLTRCYIMNKKPRMAWEVYLKLEASPESFALLTLIANDCYRLGQFFYSAKAFDILDKMDPTPEYWEGRRGACVGTFQQVIAGKESKEILTEVLQMLRSANWAEAEGIAKLIRKWASSNEINV